MIKLKNILKDLELGKVYTDKDKPPFQVEPVNEANKMSTSYKMNSRDKHDVEKMWFTAVKDKRKKPGDIKDYISKKLKINYFEVSAYIDKNILDESVNEGDKKKYWDLYTKWYKTYEAFARETMNLAKSATKVGTTGSSDERIILKNFKKQVIPFVGLMSSWSKGHEKNPHISESDLGLTYKKGKTVKVTHKKSGKELVVVDKPAVIKKYEKLGFYAESVNEGKFSTEMVNQAVGIAFHYRDNMTKAVKAIEKMKKGLSKDKEVAYALRTANESVNEGVDDLLSKMKKVSALKRYVGGDSEVEYKDIPLQIFKKLFGDPKKIKVKLPGAIDVKGGKVTVYAESVNESDKKEYNTLYVNMEKAYEKFAREVVHLAQASVKLIGGQTDKKIILKHFHKHVLEFMKLMISWNKGRQSNPHISELDEKVASPFSKHLTNAQEEIEWMIGEHNDAEEEGVYSKPREAIKLLQIAQKSLGKIK